MCLNQPVKAEILVVEGWIHDKYFDLVVEEFHNGYYQQIITTGAYLSNIKSDTSCLSYPQRAAERLEERGVPKDKIIQLPWNEFYETKTFSSFLPLKNWLQTQDPKIKTLNLYTASVHARKSYLLCRKALEDDIQIGVISGPAMEYNPRLWIFSKRGIWLVFKNTGSLIVHLFQK